jgi:uncharacterized protein involved in tolerance to divalent cations
MKTCLLPFKKTLRRFYIDFYRKLSQYNIKFVQSHVFQNLTYNYEGLFRQLKQFTSYGSESDEEDIRWTDLLEDNKLVCICDVGIKMFVLTPEALVFLLNLYNELEKCVKTIKEMNCVYDYDDKTKMDNEIKIELSRFIKTFQRVIKMIDKHIPFQRTFTYKTIFNTTQQFLLTNWEKDMKDVENRVKNIF